MAREALDDPTSHALRLAHNYPTDDIPTPRRRW